MTPENQRDEDLKKAEDVYNKIHLIWCAGTSNFESPKEIIAQAFTSLRQSWEREKVIDAEYRKLMQEALDAIKKEKAGLEERVRELEENSKKELLDYNKARKELVWALKNRNSISCDHCERQYDDSVCDKCWPDTLMGRLNYSSLIAQASVGEKKTRKKMDWMERELTRLKARNEELERKLKIEMEQTEDARNVALRMSASLAAAHEALEDIASKTKESVDVESRTVYEWPTKEARIAQKALSDPTGKLAHERWRRMEAVVSAARFISKNVAVTDPVAVRVVHNLDDALEALDASEGGGK